eukprot:g141.t1
MEAAIREDREKHPGCAYNRSSQSSFQRRGEETTTETIERVFRQCRGEAPVEIYRESSQSSGEGSVPEDGLGGMMGGGRMGGGMMGGGMVGGFGGGRMEAEHGAGMLDEIFRGFFGMDPWGQRPHHQGPPRDYRPRSSIPPHWKRTAPDEDADEKRTQRNFQRYRRYDRKAEEV